MLNNQVLLKEIIATHQKYPAFGLDSMYHYLKPKFGASRARIHRLMVKFNIHSIRTKAYKVTTYSEHSRHIAPNLVNRNFNPPLPNMIWVGDITYIKTAQGWLYLAIVKDLCTKKIVGYSFSNRIDSNLVCEALIIAINRQNPPNNLIFHSDRGSQYCSHDFRTRSEAKTAIFRYIEGYYNLVRPHSALNWLSSIVFEQSLKI